MTNPVPQYQNYINLLDVCVQLSGYSQEDLYQAYMYAALRCKKFAQTMHAELYGDNVYSVALEYLRSKGDVGDTERGYFNQWAEIRKDNPVDIAEVLYDTSDAKSLREYWERFYRQIKVALIYKDALKKDALTGDIKTQLTAADNETYSTLLRDFEREVGASVYSLCSNDGSSRKFVLPSETPYVQRLYDEQISWLYSSKKAGSVITEIESIENLREHFNEERLKWLLHYVMPSVPLQLPDYIANKFGQIIGDTTTLTLPGENWNICIDISDAERGKINVKGTACFGKNDLNGSTKKIVKYEWQYDIDLSAEKTPTVNANFTFTPLGLSDDANAQLMSVFNCHLIQSGFVEGETGVYTQHIKNYDASRRGTQLGGDLINKYSAAFKQVDDQISEDVLQKGDLSFEQLRDGFFIFKLNNPEKMQADPLFQALGESPLIKLKIKTIKTIKANILSKILVDNNGASLIGDIENLKLNDLIKSYEALPAVSKKDNTIQRAYLALIVICSVMQPDAENLVLSDVESALNAIKVIAAQAQKDSWFFQKSKLAELLHFNERHDSSAAINFSCAAQERVAGVCSQIFKTLPTHAVTAIQPANKTPRSIRGYIDLVLPSAHEVKVPSIEAADLSALESCSDVKKLKSTKEECLKKNSSKSEDFKYYYTQLCHIHEKRIEAQKTFASLKEQGNTAITLATYRAQKKNVCESYLHKSRGNKPSRYILSAVDQALKKIAAEAWLEVVQSDESIEQQARKNKALCYLKDAKAAMEKYIDVKGMMPTDKKYCSAQFIIHLCDAIIKGEYAATDIGDEAKMYDAEMVARIVYNRMIANQKASKWSFSNRFDDHLSPVFNNYVPTGVEAWGSAEGVINDKIQVAVNLHDDASSKSATFLQPGNTVAQLKQKLQNISVAMDRYLSIYQSSQSKKDYQAKLVKKLCALAEDKGVPLEDLRMAEYSIYKILQKNNRDRWFYQGNKFGSTLAKSFKDYNPPGYVAWTKDRTDEMAVSKSTLDDSQKQKATAYESLLFLDTVRSGLQPLHCIAGDEQTVEEPKKLPAQLTSTPIDAPSPAGKPSCRGPSLFDQKFQTLLQSKGQAEVLPADGPGVSDNDSRSRSPSSHSSASGSRNGDFIDVNPRDTATLFALINGGEEVVNPGCQQPNSSKGSVFPAPRARANTFSEFTSVPNKERVKRPPSSLSVLSCGLEYGNGLTSANPTTLVCQ